MKKGKVETMDIFGPENVMAQAKRVTMEKAKQKGTECPCCGQFVKVYRRTINSTMARQLITAHAKHGTEWFHTRDVVLMDSAGAGDFSKLECWGLIRRAPHVQGEEGKRTSGMWKITPLGQEFIAGKKLVPKYAFIYNGTLLELGGVDMHIQHALGKKFDYREIMGWQGSHAMPDRVTS
jgi:hypothetical protein